MRGHVDPVEKDHTEMRIFICRAKPSKGMIETATKAGVYRWPFNNQDYPKIQIITVEELLDGKKPDMPLEYGTLAQAPTIEDTGNQLSLD